MKVPYKTDQDASDHSHEQTQGLSPVTSSILSDVPISTPTPDHQIPDQLSVFHQPIRERPVLRLSPFVLLTPALLLVLVLTFFAFASDIEWGKFSVTSHGLELIFKRAVDRSGK